MQVQINGEARNFDGPLTVESVLQRLGFDPRKIAVERNLEIVPKGSYGGTPVMDGDKLEIVHFIGGGANTAESQTAENQSWEVAGRKFDSRLIVGTGKYRDFAETARAVEASGAEIVTVAVRRVNIGNPGEPMLIDFLDPKKYTYLPNTAGCYTADDAIRTARLGREVGLSEWGKLEVIGDERTLFPDNAALLEATRVLVQEGFVVLPYTSDDPVICRQLEDAGAAAVMPLGAPIGSGLGIQNRNNIQIIKEFAGVPVIVDAGVGTASDAAIAMELGVAGVLMNTAIAAAQDPVAMAEAMKLGVVAGRQAYLAGRMPRRRYATASSPPEGLVTDR